MLARPEVCTREHILLWLAGKPRDELYPWSDPFKCACGQYAKEFGILKAWFVNYDFTKPLDCLNSLAQETPHTFGALFQRALRAWL